MIESLNSVVGTPGLYQMPYSSPLVYAVKVSKKTDGLAAVQCMPHHACAQKRGECYSRPGVTDLVLLCSVTTGIFEQAQEDDNLFMDEQIYGTPDYIAPEVILMQGYGELESGL